MKFLNGVLAQASGGNPECGPLFLGRGTPGGKRWGGLQVDPRSVGP